jgi:hypothetical protein
MLILSPFKNYLSDMHKRQYLLVFSLNAIGIFSCPQEDTQGSNVLQKNLFSNLFRVKEI